MQIHGVKAQVYLKYEQDMESLSQKLSHGMIIPDFFFDTDDEFPHEVTGYCEVLGFEIWLNKSTEFKSYSYVIKLETMLSIQESFNNKMYDISPWLARYISKICGIDTCIFNSDGQFLQIKD